MQKKIKQGRQLVAFLDFSQTTKNKRSRVKSALAPFSSFSSSFSSATGVMWSVDFSFGSFAASGLKSASKQNIMGFENEDVWDRCIRTHNILWYVLENNDVKCKGIGIWSTVKVICAPLRKWLRLVLLFFESTFKFPWRRLVGSGPQASSRVDDGAHPATTRVNRERRKPSVTPRCKNLWGSTRAAFEIPRILQNFTSRKSHRFSTESNKHDIEICNPQDCGKATRHGNRELFTMACMPSSKHAERKLFHRICILGILFYTRQLSWALPFALLVEAALSVRTLRRKATWQRIFCHLRIWYENDENLGKIQAPEQIQSEFLWIVSFAVCSSNIVHFLWAENGLTGKHGKAEVGPMSLNNSPKHQNGQKSIGWEGVQTLCQPKPRLVYKTSFLCFAQWGSRVCFFVFACLLLFVQM